MELSSPQFRQELVYWVRALAAPDAQPASDAPKPWTTLAFECICEDAEAVTEPNEAVGRFLRDKAEANAVASLALRLKEIAERLFDRSPYPDDDQWFADPDWPAVVSAATRASSVLARTGS